MAVPRSGAILLVEDDAAVRRVIAEAARQHGFDVLEAESGMAGLALVKAGIHTFDLAIIDMVMPGMSGLDLASELDRILPTLPILYISGCTDSIAMEVIERRSPGSVLYKPFDGETLMERIEALLRANVLPWRKLMEASDEIGPGTAILAYKNTPAAFGVASVHAAILRTGGLPYRFRESRTPGHPFELAVRADDRERAYQLIGVAGLGADIAPAA